jgi:hypothetical protein
MIYIPDRMGSAGIRCHHVTQNGLQLKTYEFYISEIFYLIFLTTIDHGKLKPQKIKPWVSGG